MADRTAVVWDLLRGALAERIVAIGRETLEILDAGGGTGVFAVPLAELGHRVTVVDPSPDALAALERRAAEAGVRERVRALQGDAAGLLDVVAPGAADLVLCHGVLEYVEDPAVALATVAHCLPPGGTLSLLAANRHAAVLAKAVTGHFADARRAFDDPVGRWGDADPVPRRFTAEALLDLLAGTGFSVSEVHGVRVFSDLVPATLLGDPGAAAELARLESAAADHPAFRSVASQLHALASRD